MNGTLGRRAIQKRHVSLSQGIYVLDASTECAPFPSSAEEGWPRHEEKSGEATLNWSGRGGAGQVIHYFPNTTPSARNNDASRFLITPRIRPSSAEEGNTRYNPSGCVKYVNALTQEGNHV